MILECGSPTVLPGREGRDIVSDLWHGGWLRSTHPGCLRLKRQEVKCVGIPYSATDQGTERCELHHVKGEAFHGQVFLDPIIERRQNDQVSPQVKLPHLQTY